MVDVLAYFVFNLICWDEVVVLLGLSMGIAMSGTNVDQREKAERRFIMTQWIIYTVCTLWKMKHYLTLNLDGFIQ